MDAIIKAQLADPECQEVRLGESAVLYKSIKCEECKHFFSIKEEGEKMTKKELKRIKEFYLPPSSSSLIPTREEIETLVKHIEKLEQRIKHLERISQFETRRADRNYIDKRKK